MQVKHAWLEILYVSDLQVENTCNLSSCLQLSWAKQVALTAGKQRNERKLEDLHHTRVSSRRPAVLLEP